MNIDLIIVLVSAIGVVTFFIWGYSEVSLIKYGQIDLWLKKYPNLYDRQTKSIHTKVANFQYQMIKKHVYVHERMLLNDKQIASVKKRVLNYFNNIDETD